jgi:hypothetical protein
MITGFQWKEKGMKDKIDTSGSLNSEARYVHYIILLKVSVFDGIKFMFIDYSRLGFFFKTSSVKRGNCVERLSIMSNEMNPLSSLTMYLEVLLINPSRSVKSQTGRSPCYEESCFS